MSEKRSAEEDAAEGRQNLAKTARLDDFAAEDGCQESAMQQPEPEPEPATPLPISNPFGARFRAPELQAGEFHVLDEARSDDEPPASDEDESDVDEDELMEMLDADLPEKFKGTRRVRGGRRAPAGASSAASAAAGEDEQGNFEERVKVVLIEKGRNPVEPLPEGWVQVTHMSGMHVYLHRQSRVATISRPYFLGPGSLRKHDVPLYSIPCLQYLRELEKAGEVCPVSASTQPEAGSAATPQSNGGAPGSEDAAAAAAEDGAGPGEAEKDGAASNGTSAGNEALTNGSAAGGSGSERTEPAENGACERTPAGSEAASPSEPAVSECETVEPTPATSAAPSPAPPPPAAGAAGPAPSEGSSVVVKDPSLTPQEVNEYCAKRFQFKTIRLMKFNTWRERRQYIRKKRTQRPQMSSKTKLLTFPIQPSKNCTAEPGARPREWVLNPGGKSYVCILHEYLQHVLREQPVYSYSELENAATPYGATVSVQGVRYGSGYGSSKKQAKSEAAKATLQIFIPNLMDEIDGDQAVTGSTKPADMDLSFFDSIRLEDPRVADLCSKAAEPAPYTILLLCLQRNFGLTGNQVTCKLHTNKHQHNEFEMTVGKHTARVPCKNKKDGKHLAAQSLLQQLHPHVTTWGSLLRLYGNHSSKSLKVKRQEEQQITLLQSRATVNSPNYAILEKLRHEMSKLQEVRKQIQPIGLLQLEESHSGPSESGVTLDVVDL